MTHKQRESMIIIGAGLGGLSTGCYAQMNGYKTQILELHEIPGGCCTRGNAMIFASTVHQWLLGSGPGNEMHQIWREIGALDSKEVRHPEIFNIVTALDGRSVRFYSDPDACKHTCWRFHHRIKNSSSNSVMVCENLSSV